jgi:hypothetical protein
MAWRSDCSPSWSWTLADLVSRHAALAGHAPDEGTERQQGAPIGGREVRLDRLDGLDDVRVGVEDP